MYDIKQRRIQNGVQTAGCFLAASVIYVDFSVLAS